MKKTVFFLVLLFIGLAAFSQVNTIDPPYKRFPEYPPVKLLLPDSISYFTKDDLKKKTPILLVMFNPQCEHCQQGATDLVKNIEEFKKIQIVMTTSMPFDSMLVFRERFKLADHKNIVVGQDKDFFLFSYFQNRNLPFHAMYDKNKALIKVHEGFVSIRAILEMFKD